MKYSGGEKVPKRSYSIADLDAPWFLFSSEQLDICLLHVVQHRFVPILTQS